MSNESRLHLKYISAIVSGRQLSPKRQTHAVALSVLSIPTPNPKPQVHSVALSVMIKVKPGIPVNLRQTSSTVSSVTIEWEASVSGITPDSYEFKLGASGTVSTVTSPHVIHGIVDPYDTYEVYVRAVKGSSRSEWATLWVSPTILFTINTERQRRVSDISVYNRVNIISPSAVRRRRTSEIGFEQGIRLRANMNRRRRVSNISLERPVISVRLSGTRRRRTLSSSLVLQSTNFSVTATRRRRTSQLILERPSASVSFAGVRRRRAFSVRILVPEIFLQPTMIRRHRTANLRIGPTVMSAFDGTTEVLRLHSDGVWRPIELAFTE